MYYGRWLIEGYPKVILFDVESAAFKLGEWRQELFEKCHIGLPSEDTEANNCLIFGFLTCWFISEVRTVIPDVLVIATLSSSNSFIVQIL